MVDKKYKQNPENFLDGLVTNSDDIELKNAICKALADKYSRVILAYAMDKPKSVIEMSKDCKIPISTVYRRIRDLTNAGLLNIKSCLITIEGKKYYLYRSKIKAINTIFGINSVNIEIIFNDDMGKSAYW